jgi:hypothetical protein
VSSMELFAVQQSGEVDGIGDARNSYGGAMHIWNTLYRRWGFGDYVPPGNMAATKRLWDHVADPGVSHLDRVMMLWTFDLAFVKRENIERFVADIRAWWADNSTGRGMDGEVYDVADTIPRAAEIVERAFSDQALRGLLTNHTSVNSDLKWESHGSGCQCEPDPDWPDEETVCRNFDHYQTAHDEDHRFADIYEWADQITRDAITPEAQSNHVTQPEEK